MKNIRKDVFHYLKAVLEESRIFLPMKLPEDTFSPPPIQEQQVQVIFLAIITFLLKLYCHKNGIIQCCFYNLGY